MFGNINSIDTCSSNAGPGIRFVVHLQGCSARCLNCPNPERWDFKINKKISAEEILIKYESVKEFLKNGGLTVSGGEPLAQIDFVIELFKFAKMKNIHTALDTSGIFVNSPNKEKVDELLKYTDLVMFNLKHMDSVEYKKLTGYPLENVLSFLKYISSKKIPLWIKHTLIPRVTMNKQNLTKMGEFLSTIDNIQMLDIIPYVTPDISKYSNLGLEYHLKNIPPVAKQQVTEAKNFIIDIMRKTRV